MGFEGNIQSDRWEPVTSINRSFVKHIDSGNSPGKIWRQEPADSNITLSVIIPTIDAHRDGYLPKLLIQISRQSFAEYQIVVVKGDPSQGRAINTAAALSKGKYILTLDDDTSLPDPMTFNKLVAIMESHPDIGIAGGNNIVPSDAKLFVRRVMHELPRRSWEPVQEIVDSDLAEHPCMIMRTEEFKLVGGENELIPRGLDPYLRQEFRKIHKRVVVVPKVIYHHLPPDSFGKLLVQFYRNGRQAAYAQRNFPQWMIETPQKHGHFKEKRTFLFRIARFPLRLLQALVTGKPIWFICEVFYALGFASECISSEKT
jgi:glycosyltransferase involved in cell wall biosynthesis